MTQQTICFNEFLLLLKSISFKFIVRHKFQEDTILFIEDDATTNALAEFERDLQALMHQDDFHHVKALVIGRFQKGSKITREGLEFVISTKEKLKNIPIIANVDFGHTSPILTIPLGGFAKIENGCFTIKG